jgi:hypothetical protein
MKIIFKIIRMAIRPGKRKTEFRHLCSGYGDIVCNALVEGEGWDKGNFYFKQKQL